jgi:hypothetical protein
MRCDAAAPIHLAYAEKVDEEHNAIDKTGSATSRHEDVI